SSNHMPPLSFSGMLGGVQKSNPERGGHNEDTPFYTQCSIRSMAGYDFNELYHLKSPLVKVFANLGLDPTKSYIGGVSENILLILRLVREKCGSYFLFLSFLQPIGKAVGDWYFGRSSAIRKIDCPYPCNSSCRNVAKDFMEE
ncbi:hypothetical protein GW17_00056629, partial [Ensete ventricosum]